ncbi:MAG: alkaline phosphatase family protein [Actinomycetota bacterium]
MPEPPPSDGPTAPPYARGTLADVLPSAAAALGVPGFIDALGLAESTAGARHIVVCLVDGLGFRQLAAHAELAPVLASARGHAVSACFPSTTPVGLGSLGTGRPPGMHGMVGASFWLPEIDRILHPLGWYDEPHPTAVQPDATVLEAASAFGVDVVSVGPRAFAQSGLTRAVLRGGDYRGADSVGERIAEASRSASGRSLTYVYWGDLDKTGHIHGVDSDAWREELRHVDLLVSRLRESIGPDASLVVTADHGMVDCPDAQRVDIDGIRPLSEGVRRLAGEPRMRHVYARPGAASEVAATWAETLGERAWVLSREAIVDMGLVGDVEPDYAERLGDVLAIARDRFALCSEQVDAVVSSLRGQHGSVTPEEMDIPLLVMSGGR